MSSYCYCFVKLSQNLEAENYVDTRINLRRKRVSTWSCVTTVHIPTQRNVADPLHRIHSDVSRKCRCEIVLHNRFTVAVSAKHLLISASVQKKRPRGSIGRVSELVWRHPLIGVVTSLSGNSLDGFFTPKVRLDPLISDVCERRPGSVRALSVESGSVRSVVAIVLARRCEGGVGERRDQCARRVTAYTACWCTIICNRTIDI